MIILTTLALAFTNLHTDPSRGKTSRKTVWIIYIKPKWQINGMIEDLSKVSLASYLRGTAWWLRWALETVLVVGVRDGGVINGDVPGHPLPPLLTTVTSIAGACSDRIERRTWNLWINVVLSLTKLLFI